MNNALVLIPRSDLVGDKPVTMTAEDLKALLEKLGHDDAEVGHALADDLMRSALFAIANGHSDPQALAEAVLVAESAEFPRWMA